MSAYLGRRLLQGLLVVFGALLISFVLTSLSGNPADVLGGGLLTQEQYQELVHELGYDRPLGERFLNYIIQAFQGDFGQSYRFGESALGVVLDALPSTLALVAGAVGLALVIALPISFVSVLRRESRTDRTLRTLVMLAQGFPEFWLGLVLTLIFTVWLGALPSLGFGGFESLVLPTIALAVPLAPSMVRLLRGQLLDVMKLDFIVALRAKGLSEFQIVVRHGLRNALPLFVTLLALQVGWLLGGTLVVEAVFAWPGVGGLLLEAVATRDLVIVQAVVVVVATTYVLLNLAADTVVVLIDPRVRISSHGR